MLNPVVIPIPLALAVLASLGLVVGAYNAWTARTTWKPRPAVSGAGRHRLESIAAPSRPQPPRSALAVRLEQTRKRDGNSMWSWSDENWAGDTREMAAAR